MRKEIKNDPENYHRLSEPFESMEKANEALKLFYEEVAEVRKKHGIRDVYVIVNDSVVYEDEGIGEFMTTSSFGSSLNSLGMTAYAYGQEKSEHEERISKLLSKKAK